MLMNKAPELTILEREVNQLFNQTSEELRRIFNKANKDAEHSLQQFNVQLATHLRRSGIFSKPDEVIPMTIEERADAILVMVADQYGVLTDQLVGISRKRQLILPRQITMYLLRNDLMPQPSYPWISKFMGGRDHTTVIHACNKVERLAKEDVQLRLAINAFGRSIGTLAVATPENTGGKTRLKKSKPEPKSRQANTQPQLDPSLSDTQLAKSRVEAVSEPLPPHWGWSKND